jgi:hypothetical protein
MSGKIKALAVILCGVFALCACFPFGLVAPPTADSGATDTAIVEGVLARLTVDAGYTAVAQLTEIAGGAATTTPPPKKRSTPTLTMAPTNTIALSPTALPSTPTPLPPTATPTLAQPLTPCNWAEFVLDVTAPVDVIVQTGTTFNKVWRVRNIGSCTWTTSYTLVFTGGNLAGSLTVSMPFDVLPGQSVDLSVPINVPTIPGIYQGTWMLRAVNGELFGFGPNASGPLQVRLTAYRSTPVSNYAFDIAASYCSASWRSAVSTLACQGNTQDPAGSVTLLNTPPFEAATGGGYGLWTRPNTRRNGWISGQMPAYTIQNGDHFMAEVGCLSGSPGCDVTFQLDYQTSNGVIHNLGKWRETYDGRTTIIDINLSAISDQLVYFILTVNNNGVPQDANAFWLMPRVENRQLPSSYVLVWTRQGRRATNACQELRISLAGLRYAEAHAYDCTSGERSLGYLTLDAAQLSKLLVWVQSLGPSSGELYYSTSPQPIIDWIDFRGYGTATASDADLQAIDRFAAQIFNQIVR